MKRFVPSEPTSEQCTEHAFVGETDTEFAHAVWYPQMGGYVGKAVAVFDKHWGHEKGTFGSIGGCVDVYV